MAENKTLVVRINDKLLTRLENASKKAGKTRSGIVKEAIEKFLLLTEFQEIRSGYTRSVRAKGVITDEDGFKEIS